MAEPDDPCAIYVGGLSFNVDDDKLHKAFSDFGEIVSTKVIYDRETRQPRGFGFVVFTTPRAASEAMREMDGKVMDGRQIKVSEVKKKEDRERPLNRDSSFRGSFRDRDRGFARRSPGPRGGRNRSPGNRRSYSPRRRSPPSDSRRSPSPLSRSSFSPDRKDSQREGTQTRRKSPDERDRHDTDMANHEYEELRDELDRERKKRNELSDKVKALETSLHRTASSEQTLQGKVQKAEHLLKQAQAVNSQREAMLKKLQRAIGRLQDAEEQRKEYEKDLKALTASLAVEVEDMEDEV